jgi:hypothetical protein
MPIYAKAGGNFTPAPAGTHCAVCCDVVDLGEIQVSFQNKTKRQHKCALVWQISELMQDGRPFIVRRQYTLSLHERSSLRRDLEAWRCRPFTDEELQGFDLESLIGIPCLLNVVQERRDGTTYANVSNVMRLPKGMTAPAVHGYVRVCERPQAQTMQTDDNLNELGITDDDVPF